MNMRTLAVRSIRANPARFVATVLAVVVATGFLAGTLVLQASLGAALRDSTELGLQGVDAAITNEIGQLPDPTDTGTNFSTRRPNPRAGQRGDAAGRARQAGVNYDIPAEVVPRARQLPGVGAAAGILTDTVGVLDERGEPVADAATGMVWVDSDELNPFHVVEGNVPRVSGEIALDAHTAEKADAQVGDKLQLATYAGSQPVTVVGIAAFGEQAHSGRGGDVLMTEPDGFAWLNGGKAEYSSIYLAAASGTSPSELVSTVQAAVQPLLYVTSGDDLRSSSASPAEALVDVLGWALLGFAALALLVSLLIIYNTFSIIVSQRTREFALLRALGARGGQVLRSVMAEAVVLGFLASIIGYLLGIALFGVLIRVVPQVADVAPALRLRITLPAIVGVLLAGTLTTLVSALIPAWKAARTKPLEAMRASSIDRAGISRGRAITGLAFLGVGATLLLGGGLLRNFLIMVLGPPVLFLGVLVGGPVLARSFGRVSAAVIGSVSGRRAPWRLGVENVQRNPRRSAATANALVIGLFLVVLVTAGGGAVRDYAVSQLNQLGGPDVTVFSAGDALPPDFVQGVKAIDGVSGTALVYSAAGEIEGQGIPVNALDFRDGDALGLTFTSGSWETLGKDDLVLPAFFQSMLGKDVGDPVEVMFSNGQRRTLRIGAVVDASVSFTAFMSADVVREADPALAPVELDVITEPGRERDVLDAATRLSRQYAGVYPLEGNFLASIFKGFLNFIISAVNGLLSVAVLIALFGIVNTLVLSVTERTREIGLLRAVGMTRAQLRATIRTESLVVAMLGSVVGVVSGLFVAWCLTRPMFTEEGFEGSFSWPIRELVVILVLGVALGVAASVVPAWRASRLNVIESVTVE